MPARQAANDSSAHRATARNRVEALFVTPPTPEPVDNIAAWDSRPLEKHYALVFFDSLLVKVRERGLVKNIRIHLALGVSADGGKDILGHWLGDPASDRFWLDAIGQLRYRGLTSIDIAVAEQLAAEEAIRQYFPATQVGAVAFERLPPALRALCAATSAVSSVIEKRRRRGLVKERSFASTKAAVRDLLLVLQDANSDWKVAPGRWSAVKRELLALHPISPAL
ncbi:MAG: transposase [Rhizomicrobium sp.]|nr:transposase [Rhizomicrobium sp.]